MKNRIACFSAAALALTLVSGTAFAANPATWTAVQAAPSSAGEYVLLAQFNSRALWFRFDAPTSTAVTTQQNITVPLTAAVG